MMSAKYADGRSCKVVYSAPSRVWTPSSPVSRNFCKVRDDFDDDGQLDSTASKARSARSHPTARRRRNHRRSLQKLHDKGDEGVHTLYWTEYSNQAFS